MAKEASKSSVSIFLSKAEEFYDGAAKSIEEKKYDFSMFSSTQAIILANDAFCIFFLGKRPSKDHREAVNLFSEAAQRLGDASFAKTIANAFDEQAESGYTERLTKPSEAAEAIVNARKFIDFVREKVA